MSNRKRLLFAALGMVVMAALAAVALLVVAPWNEDRIADSLGHGDYRLVTTDGGTFTEASLTGTPSAVFFGYTHCPDVCPTTLGEISAWQDELGQEGKELRVFFVTVDPERDTSDLLRDYVSWVPGVTGVTGDRAEIDKAIKAFRIYAKKNQQEDGEYFMDHTATVLLFDAQGRMFEPIGYQEDVDRAVAKLRRLLNGERADS